MGHTPRRRVGLVPAAYHEHPEIGAFDLAVLYVLATHANRLGACWPSQGTIAAAAKLDRGTVNRVLAKLVDLKLVEKTKHPNPKIRCWMYRLVGHESLMGDFLSGLDDGLEETQISEPAVADTNTEHLEHSLEESLSLTREGASDAPAEPVTIEAEWVPDAADMAFAQVRRPDLSPADVALIGAKFALHYAGRTLANPTAVFQRWILTERVTRHDNSNLRPNTGCIHPAPSHSATDVNAGTDPDPDFGIGIGNRPTGRSSQLAGLVQRNRAAADDCLRRILARRGEHLSA